MQRSLAFEMMLQKRLTKEYLAFTESPLLNGGVQPREENLTIWDCALQLDFMHNGITKTFPVTFVVFFPHDYPR